MYICIYVHVGKHEYIYALVYNCTTLVCMIFWCIDTYMYIHIYVYTYTKKCQIPDACM